MKIDFTEVQYGEHANEKVVLVHAQVYTHSIMEPGLKNRLERTKKLITESTAVQQLEKNGVEVSVIVTPIDQNMLISGWFDPTPLTDESLDTYQEMIFQAFEDSKSVLTE